MTAKDLQYVIERAAEEAVKLDRRLAKLEKQSKIKGV
jgi:hypothetical protein